MIFVRWHYRDGAYVRSHHRRRRSTTPLAGQTALFHRPVDRNPPPIPTAGGAATRLGEPGGHAMAQLQVDLVG